MKKDKAFLYTKMKVFHFKEKIDSLARDNPVIMPPVHIRIKPTNACNHNCSYCAYRVERLQLGKDMVTRDFIPREKMFQIIDDLEKMGVKAVTFSGGGEPLCYPYLRDTLLRLIKTNIKFASLTNGSLLNGELAELFARKAAWVRISIDGWDDKSYSEYRRVRAGEFSQVLSNIKNFKKLKGPCFLGACIIVDRKNSAHVYTLINKLKDAGVSSIKIAPCIISNSGKVNNRYHELMFPKVKRQIARAQKESAASDIEISDAYHQQLETFEKGYRWCPYLQILPVIGADLNIYPCQDKAYNLEDGLVGSIKGKTFKEFWFSDKNNFFKINPILHCNHHCVADGKNRLIFEYLNADKQHLDFV